KRVNSIAKGYVRKLEITYNKERDDYHPHFHVLIAVNKSYFTDKRYYISQKEWLELWRDVTGISEITQVQVQ
ncbi:replication protein, partial [Stutzerimonas nitrititolerans]